MTAQILRFPGRQAFSAEPAVNPAEAALTAPAPSPTEAEPPGPTARHELRVAPLLRPRRELTPEEVHLQDQMLAAYFEGHRLAKNHTPATIQRDRKHVCDLLAYVGQPLWLLTEADFESWAAHLALERRMLGSSQRIAQSAVAACFEFLVGNRGWQNQAQRQFDARLEMIVTRVNRVIHVSDAARKRDHKVLTSEQFSRVFTLFDDVIGECAEHKLRQLRVVQRDKALFYTYYAYGLRLSEGHGLNLSSFSANPDIPELGNYGFAGVWGKGSRGSGRRFRSVPAIDPDVAPNLEWYLTHVRPQFRRKGTDAQDAMWLSERGLRLCKGSIWGRFKMFMQAVGLDPRFFTTHGLRHMSVSHGAAAGLPVAFIQSRVGHAYAATTQHYTHLQDEYQRDVAKNAVMRQLQKWEEEKPE